MSKISWVAGVCALATAARAEPYVETDTWAWHDPNLRSGIGIGGVVGGGMSGFTNQIMRDTVSSRFGGLWDVRATIGTHIPLGLDVAYIGTSQPIATLARGDNGTLWGTAVEGALRFNILPHYFWNPYVFGGAGWQHYDVQNMRFMTSDTGVRGSDNLLVVPMGAGFTFRDSTGIQFDFRGTFRWTTFGELVLNPVTGEHADLHSWEASANIGYEF